LRNVLPLEQRVVFSLSDVHGMNYEEIAVVIQAPLGTLKS
jgi:DNA-directed RNA polymerase specialized sigma24 family protein